MKLERYAAVTKKDFEWFVEWIVHHDIPHAARHELMTYFAKKNPRFDYAIFTRKLNEYQDRFNEAIYG